MTDDPHSPPPNAPDPAESSSRNHGSLWLLILIAVVALILIGFGLFIITQSARRQQDKSKEAMREAQEYVNRLNMRLQEGVDAGEARLNEQELARFSNKMREVSENLSPEEAAVAQATASFVEELNEHLAAYNQAVARLEESQGVNAGNLSSVDQIRQRREIVLAFRKANADFARFYREVPEIYREELRTAGVPSDNIGAHLSQFMSVFGPRRDILAQLRATDDVLAQHLLKILALLENQWGRWEYDDTADQVNFEAPGFQHAYAEAFQDLNETLQQQTQLHQQLHNLPNAPASADIPVTGEAQD